jgi:hypothetical protein
MQVGVLSENQRFALQACLDKVEFVHRAAGELDVGAYAEGNDDQKL